MWCGPFVITFVQEVSVVSAGLFCTDHLEVHRPLVPSLVLGRSGAEGYGGADDTGICVDSNASGGGGAPHFGVRVVAKGHVAP